MQYFKVTVNGKVYEVSVEEVVQGNTGAAAAPSVSSGCADSICSSPRTSCCSSKPRGGCRRKTITSAPGWNDFTD